MSYESMDADQFRRDVLKQPVPHKRQDVIAHASRELAKLFPSSVGSDESTIHFVIPGEPMGKPRMTRRDKWKQRPCVMKYRQWADLARSCAGTVPQSVIRLDWKAVFVPPDSWSKKKREAALGTPHRTRPDRDNIDKAILDALFKQDSGIASGFINKVWGSEPRLEVWITLTPTGA